MGEEATERIQPPEPLDRNQRSRRRKEREQEEHDNVHKKKTRAEEVADDNGERMVEMLQRIAAMPSDLLSQKYAGVKREVETMDGILHVPYIDGNRIRACEYFGWRRLVEGAEVLERIASEGIPAEISMGVIWRVD